MPDPTHEPAPDPEWYFCFRQSLPKPPGSWIACGPYGSYDQALKERQKAKAPDAEVSNVFSATSRKAADERCLLGKTG